MRHPAANPPRLSSLSEADDAVGVGRMFRSARDLPNEELPRLRWRLRTSQRLRAMRPRLYLRIAVVIGTVFCMGGVVGAVVSPYFAKKEPAIAPSPASAVAPAVRHRRPRSAAGSPAPAVLPLPALDQPTPAALIPMPNQPTPAQAPASAPAQPAHAALVPASDQPASAKHRAPVRVAVLSRPAPPAAPTVAPEARPPATPSSIAVEQALLGRAMKALREDRDARAALALLAQHQERFPKGALSSEATMLRIESLLALGRRDQALSLLDGVPLAVLPNRDQQLLVRGELRAESGRWREAGQDFDQMLRGRGLPATSAKARSLQERALWGRASARSRLGDQEGARADLVLYLRYFPAGRFAEPASAILKDTQ